VEFVLSRGKMVSRGFAANDQNFYFNIGTVPFRRNFDLTLRELYQGEILMLTLGGLHLKYAVERGI
jgi:hypothetical protein